MLAKREDEAFNALLIRLVNAIARLNAIGKSADAVNSRLIGSQAIRDGWKFTQVPGDDSRVALKLPAVRDSNWPGA